MIDDSIPIYGFTDLVEHLHLHHMYQMWSLVIRRFNESTGDMLFILHPIRQLLIPTKRTFLYKVEDGVGYLRWRGMQDPNAFPDTMICWRYVP